MFNEGMYLCNGRFLDVKQIIVIEKISYQWFYNL